MEEYKSNSHRFKELEKEKLEKVVTGTAVKKKKTGLARFADSFVSEDATNVGNYLLNDVLMPALKKTLYDMLTNGLDITLFGEKNSRNSSSVANRVSYRSYYSSPDRQYEPKTYRQSYEYDDIVLKSRSDAEAVLDRMDELIDRYGVVRIADFYELCDLPSQYTDNKYGWHDVRSAEVIRIRDGYKVRLPRPQPLD